MVRVLIALAGALALAGPSAARGNPVFALDPAQAAADLERSLSKFDAQWVSGMTRQKFALDPAQAAADLERSLSKFDAQWVSGMTRQKLDQPTAVTFSGNGRRVTP